MPDDSGITLADAKLQLSRWLAADAAVSTSQAYEYDVDGERRRLTRADAVEIRKNVEYWNVMVRRLSGAGGIRLFGVIPPA